MPLIAGLVLALVIECDNAPIVLRVIAGLASLVWLGSSLLVVVRRGEVKS